ncbi:FecR family protein [Membranihabitans marinus]|uniref:FecR family protein n=1 Tax=Membranihabitans marinus TaxID=1227546 RepID=UPI001F263AE8|nr:FecR domain-containing protein [Membranihabitans marinus]
MEDKSNQIQKLLSKYKDNSITSSEFEELITLMKNDDLTLKSEMSAHWQSNYSAVDVSQSKSKGKQLIYLRLAASVLIIIALWFLLTIDKSQDQTMVYSTGNGEVLNIELNDGSVVMLNANSELTVASDFDHSMVRQVNLEGEAYFKVAKSEDDNHKKRGFQVKTADIVIDVLGTIFNVNARKGEQRQEVFLEEGSIHYQIAEGEKKPLMPGEKIVYDDKTSELVIQKNIDVDGVASWTKGILSYHDETLGDVLRNLELLFGISLKCSDDIEAERRINLGVPYMDWENTKKALEMALGIVIEKEGHGYLILNNDQISD